MLFSLEYFFGRMLSARLASYCTVALFAFTTSAIYFDYIYKPLSLPHKVEKYSHANYRNEICVYFPSGILNLAQATFSRVSDFTFFPFPFYRAAPSLKSL
jgi:hypothetical protein